MAFSNAKSIALPLILSELEHQFSPNKDILFASYNNTLTWYREIRSTIKSFGNLHIRLLESHSEAEFAEISDECLEAYCQYVDAEQIVRRLLLTDSTESQKRPDGTDAGNGATGDKKQNRRTTLQSIKKEIEQEENKGYGQSLTAAADYVEDPLHAYMEQTATDYVKRNHAANAK